MCRATSRRNSGKLNAAPRPFMMWICDLRTSSSRCGIKCHQISLEVELRVRAADCKQQALYDALRDVHTDLRIARAVEADARKT